MATGCTITSGNVYHDCERNMTMLMFQGDSEYASHISYTCKLDEEEFKTCKFINAIQTLYNNYKCVHDGYKALDFV